MEDLIHWITDVSPFMPRGKCGKWGPYLPVVSLGANFLIALSYFTIPVVLGFLYWRKRSHLPVSWAIPLFMGFILLCGTGHICEMIVWWWPAYRLFLLVDGLTAAASFMTAVTLPFAVAELLRFIPPDEYQSALRKAEQANQKLELLLTQLETEVILTKQARDSGDRSRWLVDKHVTLDRLLEAVKNDPNTPFPPRDDYYTTPDPRDGISE